MLGPLTRVFYARATVLILLTDPYRITLLADGNMGVNSLPRVVIHPCPDWELNLCLLIASPLPHQHPFVLPNHIMLKLSMTLFSHIFVDVGYAFGALTGIRPVKI